jgi:hypothetical protein
MGEQVDTNIRQEDSRRSRLQSQSARPARHVSLICPLRFSRKRVARGRVATTRKGELGKGASRSGDPGHTFHSSALESRVGTLSDHSEREERKRNQSTTTHKISCRTSGLMEVGGQARHELGIIHVCFSRYGLASFGHRVPSFNFRLRLLRGVSFLREGARTEDSMRRRMLLDGAGKSVRG